MSIKELKIKEKETRRNYIIDDAEKLFINNDYENVSMNDIGDKVGVNKATLYNYFKNKEALYFAVILRNVKILNKMANNELNKVNNSNEKLILLANVHNEFNDKYPGCLRMLYSSQSNKFNMDNVNISEEFNGVTELLKEMIFILTDSIQLGVDDGTIRPDVNPVEAAILISLIFQGVSNISLFNKNILESRQINEKTFTSDVGDFIHHMLINKEK